MVKANWAGVVIVAICAALIAYVLKPTENAGQRKIAIDLREKTIDFTVHDDTIDMSAFIETVLEQETSLTKAALNAHGFFKFDDTALVDQLEKTSETNPLVDRLRADAASFHSIFSNNLRPTTVAIAPQFANGMTKIGACEKSEFFGKRVVISNFEETIFLIAEVTQAAACSNEDSNRIYVSNEAARYLMDCQSRAAGILKMKAQVYDNDQNAPMIEPQLCEV